MSRNRIGGASAATSITASGKQQIAGLYDLEETLGEGHYAVVKLARHVFTGAKVAVKIIDKMRLDAATRCVMGFSSLTRAKFDSGLVYYKTGSRCSRRFS